MTTTAARDTFLVAMAVFVVNIVIGILNALPLNILVASDHAVYIGVITNIVLALLSLLVLSEADRRGWIGHVIFWGVNLGLIVFAIGLIVDTADLKRIGAPVMGITLLVALAILAMRAVGREPDTSALED